MYKYLRVSSGQIELVTAIVDNTIRYRDLTRIFINAL